MEGCWVIDPVCLHLQEKKTEKLYKRQISIGMGGNRVEETRDEDRSQCIPFYVVWNLKLNISSI